jgi:A/G-specific adenine glycosylase
MRHFARSPARKSYACDNSVRVSPATIRSIRKALHRWYEKNRRDLPWRNTRDPYRIWVSEVMLQQTRVAAVIPYYERFLKQFPSVQVLAKAPEEKLLAAWSGLGYYSRARNMQKAARQIVELGSFPDTYEAIRELSGVGDYTAAAVASIAFDKPHAVVDGNVLRVLARLIGESGDISAVRTRARLGEVAQMLLDRKDPAGSNQALMELGALVCSPRSPTCANCPTRRWCTAHAEGRQAELPVKLGRKPKELVEQCMAIIVSRKRVLLKKRIGEDARLLAGFWELPQLREVPGAKAAEYVGEIRHNITYNEYRVSVVRTSGAKITPGLQWVKLSDLTALPLTTLTRKALRLAALGGLKKMLGD